MKFSFLICIFLFLSKLSSAQDTLKLSSTYFSLSSCYIDSLGKIELGKIEWKAKKYKIHYTEYATKTASAHYSYCRTKELKLYLETNFGLTITILENVVLPTFRKKEKGKPAFSEIYLVSEE